MRILVIPEESGNVHTLDIDGSLEMMQDLVDGPIQCAPMPQLNSRRIELVVNEEGLLAGLPPNENLWPFFYVGQVFMVGTDGEDFVSLTDTQLAYAKGWLKGLEDGTR